MPVASMLSDNDGLIGSQNQRIHEKQTLLGRETLSTYYKFVFKTLIINLYSFFLLLLLASREQQFSYSTEAAHQGKENANSEAVFESKNRNPNQA